MVDSYSVLPLSPLRKIIAARMTEAKQTIPHFRLVADIEMDAILALRLQFNEANPETRISVNDCVIKACASALMEYPAVNCQLIAEEIRQFAHADISVVIAVEGGLATPVVRQADRKSVREIASEIKVLSQRAANGQLKMHEIVGGSFSISNLGGFGVDQFDAIINPPQCAILAVGRAKPQCVVSAEGKAHIATLMRVTLSADHRAIDGATAAAFLARLRVNLEQPIPWFRIG